MIIQLDSNYRDYNQYPYESEFILPINNQPYVKESSEIGTNLSRDYIRFFYKWVGNTSFTNPISKIQNDTLRVKYIPISKNSCIYIPNESVRNQTIKTDYFIGTIFWSNTTKLSASIIESKDLIITLDTDIFDIFFEYLNLNDLSNRSTSNFEFEGEIINPSTHKKNNLLILTNQFFVFAFQSSGILKGISPNFIIENVSKNWSRKISKVELNRNVILKEIPSYDSNDFFVVWDSNFKTRYGLSNEPFVNGVRDYEIIESDLDFQKGDILSYKDLKMQVEKVDSAGIVKILKIIYPGNSIFEKSIVLSNELNESKTVKINVSIIGSGVILDTNEVINIDTYMLSFVNINDVTALYYTIFERKNSIFYLDINNIQINILKEGYKIENNIYAYFIYYDKILPNLNAPLISYQNLMCVEMKILSISLPNLPVCGYNIRLADFPYLLLTVCNSNGQSCEIKQNLISNIPATQKTNFILPIANVRNPELNFVSLTTNQTAIFKFSPRDSLLFRIFLPNGQLLKFNVFEQKNIFNFNCNPLTLPLNSYFSVQGEETNLYPPNTNSKLIYPYILEHGISIVLQFDFL